jgi:hypothetical protein
MEDVEVLRELTFEEKALGDDRKNKKKKRGIF